MGYSRRDVSVMQREIAPAIYGKLDLDKMPERFRTEIDSPLSGMARKVDVNEVAAVLENSDEVELYRQLTLMGDPIADAFAARIPEFGMKRARAMLDQALEEGIDAVKDAPPELVALIDDLEKVPAWLDMERVDRFHRTARVFHAISQEYMMRLAFMLTYANGYAGLPMMITGALTGPSAANRMKETTSTFRLSCLPGALGRDGAAFKSAAKVRMMHAMVRMSLLGHPERWDYDVYGVPIPQVDQMGAALSFNFFAAFFAQRAGRELTDFELDGIEASRYLAYLLGMHDYFLGNTIPTILTSWSMLGATLRDKIDPRSVDLNHATLYAYTRAGTTPYDKLMHELDVRNTRFLYTIVMGKELATKLGVTSKPTDPLATVALAVPIAAVTLAMNALKKLPGGEERVDAWAIGRMRRLLERSGEAKYSTEPAHYAKTHAQPAMRAAHA